MRGLVTGTAGFIGGALARHLAGSGHSVLGLDVRPHQPEGVETIKGDIRNRDALLEALGRFGPEGVVHLTARTDLAETGDLGAYAANVEGVRKRRPRRSRRPAASRAPSSRPRSASAGWYTSRGRRWTTHPRACTERATSGRSAS